MLDLNVSCTAIGQLKQMVFFRWSSLTVQYDTGQKLKLDLNANWQLHLWRKFIPILSMFHSRIFLHKKCRSCITPFDQPATLLKIKNNLLAVHNKYCFCKLWKNLNRQLFVDIDRWLTFCVLNIAGKLAIVDIPHGQVFSIDPISKLWISYQLFLTTWVYELFLIELFSDWGWIYFSSIKVVSRVS